MNKLEAESGIEYDPELADKIKVIRRIALDPRDLAEIILVLIGLKPGGDFDVHVYDESPRKIKKKLESIGLIVKEEPEEEPVQPYRRTVKARFVIGLNEDVVNQNLGLKRNMENFDEKYGRLMGYPETAIQAFVKKETRPILQDGDLENKNFWFKPSSSHYEEDMQVARQWSSAIEQYAPELMTAMLQRRKNARNARETSGPLGMIVGETRIRPRIYFALRGIVNKLLK